MSVLMQIDRRVMPGMKDLLYLLKGLLDFVREVVKLG